MTVTDVLDVLAALLLVVAALLSVAAGVGLVRFPDALSRMHAGTKPQILGLICVVLAIALSMRQWSVLLMLIPVVVLQLLTAPMSAHMIGRAGYRTGDFRGDLLVADELEDDIARADKASSEEVGPPVEGRLDEREVDDPPRG
jgi:multicomponent Na+:H+ antiporter subunit G